MVNINGPSGLLIYAKKCFLKRSKKNETVKLNRRFLNFNEIRLKNKIKILQTLPI